MTQPETDAAGLPRLGSRITGVVNTTDAGAWAGVKVWMHIGLCTDLTRISVSSLARNVPWRLLVQRAEDFLAAKKSWPTYDRADR